MSALPRRAHITEREGEVRWCHSDITPVCRALLIAQGKTLANQHSVQFVGSPVSEQSAHHSANQSTWTTAVVVVSATPAATTGRTVVIGFVAANAGARRRDGLGQQRLMLQRVEEASLGIAACRLPAHDDGPGRLVEPSVDLGVEAETGQPALHVATLSLVKAHLIFGFLRCLVGKGRRIDGCQLVAIDRARTGFGNICIDENSQHRQCEDEDTQWLIFPDLQVSR
jgi:hypothetical protein